MNTSLTENSEALTGEAATIQVLDDRQNVKLLATIEAEAISFAIQHHKGCMSSAATSLGIGRSTLYRKIKNPSYASLFEGL